ncbi:MAG: PAS domain-containing protein [Lacisediminimonas sp.]|nr:PAS domain-containing protein [Lacisediminimonas sp.]
MLKIERSDIQSVRKGLNKLGMVIAEIDTDLRYVWIDNPHPDFDAAAVVGKRDDDLLPLEDARHLMDCKREVLARTDIDAACPSHRIFAFHLSDGIRYYSIAAYPIVDERGRTDGVFTVGFVTRAMDFFAPPAGQ